MSCFYLFGDFRDGLSRTQFLIALYDLRLRSFVRESNILPTCRGGSRIVFRRGCTRLLLYFNSNKPHSFFFWQNTSCIRKPRVISGEGAHPLHPPPRSAPDMHNKIINTVLLVPVENSKVECSVIIFRSDYLEYCGVRDIEVFRFGSTPKSSCIILNEVAQCYL